MNPLKPEMMTADERLTEIGQILANAWNDLRRQKTSALAATVLGHVRPRKWLRPSDWTVRANEACHWTRRQPTAFAGAGTRT